MNLDSLTLGEIKQLKCLFKGEQALEHPFKVGQKYAIRTVTMIYVGKLEQVFQNELVLSGCAWVADTGRFYNFLAEGKVNEVEPMPGEVIVGRGGIIDASIWNHDLIAVQK